MPQHSEEKWVPFTPEEMFALVADVESYPSFLPWCAKAEIVERREGVLVADLEVGLKGLRERFTSQVTLVRPHAIKVSYVGGALLNLENRWGFASEGEGCRLSFFVDFKLRSVLLSAMMDLVFDHAFKKMTSAFEKRALELYRRPALDGAGALPEKA